MSRNPVLLYKTLVIGVIFLFIGVSVQPSIGFSNNDDTTPPVTTYTLDPPEPDGLNGWYVSDVTVTLNATDDMSGVNNTYYRIDSGEWEIYTEIFTLSVDGDNILVEYYSVDYADNVEDMKSFRVDIDQTKPDVSLNYETYGWNPLEGWEFVYITTATDDTSGMERVEFYINHKLMETVYGKGPEYTYWYFYNELTFFRVIGLIRNLEITDKYVKFKAIAVIIIGPFYRYKYPETRAYDKAGNMAIDGIMWSPIIMSPGLFLFRKMELPNNYEGQIGNYFIRATFDGHMQPG